MPDITMCNGGDCIKKSNCYRYMAKPDSYQSFFAEVPKETGDDCKHYWEMATKVQTKSSSKKSSKRIK